MTRSARRHLKKTPHSATPWRSLKATKYSRFKDEESSTDGPESSARLISCLQKVKRGQLKETRKEKLTEKLSHKLLRKIKQIRVSRRLRRQSREDPETVALLPPAQTKETKPSKSLAKKAQTRETSLRKKKKKVTSSVVKNKKQTLSESLDESSVSAHDAESLVEDRDLDSDKMPLLLRNRATEKKRRQVEARRLRRQRRKVCFNCRKAGHLVEECPQPQTAGICYRCGSADHTSRKCPRQQQRPSSEGDDYPYAKCFVCGEIGHLSKSCPDNPRGLYPNGGCCKLCGSVEHLKANCPEKLKKGAKHQSSSEFGGLIANPHSSADAEVDVRSAEVEKSSGRRRGNAGKSSTVGSNTTKHKVVKF